MFRLLLWSLIGPAVAQTPVDTPAVSEASVPDGGRPGPVPHEQQTWLGVLSVLGERKVPLLGKVEFQTDTYVLAQTVRTEDGWKVVQSTCRVDFPKTMGAQILVDPAAFDKIPKAEFAWEVASDGTWRAGPWPSGWNEADHDKDGEPGITLEVRAPFCGGEIHASSEASQTASGKPTDNHVVKGDITIHVVQKTLGTKGPCLRLMARDSDETMQGQFAFVEAPTGTTCKSEQEWPRVEW